LHDWQLCSGEVGNLRACLNIFILSEKETNSGWMRREKRSLAALNEHFRGEIQPELGHLQQNKKF